MKHNIQPDPANHQDSVKRYPHLNLSEHEHVISEVKRHSIGLVIPLVVGLILLAISLSVAIYSPMIAETLILNGSEVSDSAITWLAIIVATATVLGVYIAYYVYTSNRFYLTNESVIQEVQISLFSRREQTIGLNSVEDISYFQHSLLSQIFNYGTLRLSTIGDEHTYQLTYVLNPRYEANLLNNAVETFKQHHHGK